MKQFFTDDDLSDLLSELEQQEDDFEPVEDEEVEASNRRYREIIQKHKNS